MGAQSHGFVNCDGVHCRATVDNNYLTTMENFKRRSAWLLAAAVVAVLAGAVTGGRFEPWRGVAARWASRLHASIPGTGGTGWQAQALSRPAQQGTSLSSYGAHGAHGAGGERSAGRSQEERDLNHPSLGNQLFSSMLSNLITLPMILPCTVTRTPTRKSANLPPLTCFTAEPSQR